MKKLFTFIALVAISMAANAQSPNYDVNNDGEVNVTDVACLTNYIVGLVSASEDDSAYHYDMNGDGIASVTDVMVLVDYILHPVQPFYLTCPDDNHPHLIDLGLPSGTKWACCNVGADKPEAYGGYYAWGETEEKDSYDEYSYQYYQNGKYENLGSDIAGTQYDVAHVKWGGSWVMPSLDQIKELLDNCTTQWTTKNGVMGRTFTGPSGGTVFLPVAGRRWKDYPDYASSRGYYWSSSQDPSYSYYAYYLFLNWDSAIWSHDYRDRGHTVRPVSK